MSEQEWCGKCGYGIIEGMHMCTKCGEPTNEVERVVMPFKVGDWIIYDAIGKGVYEVVEVGIFFFDVKCKRLFEGGKLFRLGRDCKDHVTNINRGGEPIDYHNLKCKVVKAA